MPLTVGGGVFGLAGCSLLQRGLEEHIGRQQFANFYALACDQVGLPRDLPPESARRYPPPRVAEKRNPGAFGVRERHWILARIRLRSRETLRNLLEAI